MYVLGYVLDVDVGKYGRYKVGYGGNSMSVCLKICWYTVLYAE